MIKSFAFVNNTLRDAAFPLTGADLRAKMNNVRAREASLFVCHDP